MAKQFKNEYCVHCGVFYSTLTSDHVFPKSWYPDTSPENIEKWQIPACSKCNKEYGKLEEDLLIKIGLCLDPNDYASSGIADKVLRALDPRFAKSAKDKKIRDAKRKKILREALIGNQIPRRGLFPNFDKPDGFSTEPPAALLLSLTSIEKLSEKIIKGITYLDDGIIIKEPYQVKTFVLQDKDAFNFVKTVSLYGKVYSREPGIVVTRAPSKEDRVTALYFIEIWSRFKLYGIVGDKNKIPFA